MQTDGVGLSIIKQTQSTRARGSQRIVGSKKKELCASEAKRDELNIKAGLVDPNRRDLMYRMAEDTTVQEKAIYRYTSCTEKVKSKSKKHRKISEGFSS